MKTKKDDSSNHNLQTLFMRDVRQKKLPVTVFLVNGIKLQGRIVWYDTFCIMLRRDAQAQLVYKHAISTIVPVGDFFIDEENEDMDEDEI